VQLAVCVFPFKGPENATKLLHEALQLDSPSAVDNKLSVFFEHSVSCTFTQPCAFVSPHVRALSIPSLDRACCTVRPTRVLSRQRL